MTRGGIAALTWAPHSPYLEDLATRMGAVAYCIDYIWLRRRWLLPLRYLLLWLSTWATLLRQRPHCVVVINTPVFAPLCVALYCFAVRIPYVINVHGHSLGYQWAWAVPIQRWLARRALANLIDQDLFHELFVAWGARVLRMERPPTTTAPLPAPGAAAQFTVAVINTFAGDEPLEVLFQAARQLVDVRFVVLGDTARAPAGLLAQAPTNVTFPGYLRGAPYWGQLNLARAVMTLTTTRYSLVAGGVETMILQKPAILSRQPALLTYFTRGAVFVDHTIPSIVAGVRQAQAHEQQLGSAIAELATEKQADWDRELDVLMQLIGARQCRIGRSGI